MLHQVTVPQGSGPGDLLSAQLNGSPFQVTVPAGVKAGETFQVQGLQQSSVSMSPICTIWTTADGLDGVFPTDMPASLQGHISREQWDPAIRTAAAAEAEVLQYRLRSSHANSLNTSARAQVRDLLCGPMGLCCMASTCLFYLICISMEIPRKQAEVKIRAEAAFNGTPLRAEYVPGDKRSRSRITFFPRAVVSPVAPVIER